jgi:DNA-binding transcriptional ArsR family regulator
MRKKTDSVQDLSAQLQQRVKLLSAMSNAWRLQILALLACGEASVGSINVVIPVSQSSLSQHLAVLRASKIVSTRKDAQTVYYKLVSAEILGILTCLEDIDTSAPGWEAEQMTAELGQHEATKIS